MRERIRRLDAAVGLARGDGREELVRNTDIQTELKKLSEAADFDWIASAADRLNDVERGMRRNLLRSLSLDAFATALERST